MSLLYVFLFKTERGNVPTMSLFSFLMAAYAPSFASAVCLSTLLIYFRAVAEECQECV